MVTSFPVLYHYGCLDSEMTELRNHLPQTPSALSIKIHLIKVFPSSNSQKVVSREFCLISFFFSFV